MHPSLMRVYPPSSLTRRFASVGGAAKKDIMFPKFIQAGSAWQLHINSDTCAGARVLSKAAARDLVTRCLMAYHITEADFNKLAMQIEGSCMPETQLVRSCHDCGCDHQFPLGGGRWSEQFADVATAMALAQDAMRNGQLFPNQVAQIRLELHHLGVPMEEALAPDNDEVIHMMWVMAF